MMPCEVVASESGNTKVSRESVKVVRRKGRKVFANSQIHEKATIPVKCDERS
jgi:hypothetical protein